MKVLKFIGKVLDFVIDNLTHFLFCYMLIMWVFKPEFIHAFHTNDMIMFAVILITGVIKEDKK